LSEAGTGRNTPDSAATMPARRAEWPKRATPVFLTGYPKSGTTLLLSLLDGHPELNVFPRETLFFTRALPELEADREVGVRRFVERIFDNVLFGLEEVLEDRVGSEKYAAELWRRWQDSDFAISRFLEVAVEAYGTLIGRSGRHYWVEKTPHTELYAPMIREWYPTARLIHCVRDPRANYSAIRVWNEREGRSTSVTRFVSQWKASYRAANRNDELLPQLVVRYEDLVMETPSIMADVCNFLEIDFDELLLHPTLEGRPFGGNSMYQKSLSGVSRDSLERWRSILDREQIGKIEWLTRREMQSLGYSRIEPNIGRIPWMALSSSAFALLAYDIYDHLPEAWKLCFRKLRARLHASHLG
jgi:hypothetical protein